VNPRNLAKNKALKRSQSRKDAPRKRFNGKPDAPDLPVVKFKVEPLGNKACCCRIGR
jgi:hypothetical protein